MISFGRPIIVSLLCGLAIFGHVPAWLHVGGCEHEGHSHVSSRTASIELDACQHHCCHHASEQTSHDGDQQSTDTNTANSGDGHDSDSCPICQSLVAPNGVIWRLDLPEFQQLQTELAQTLNATSPQSTDASVHRLRGPPASHL
ncbi:hypothetical protein [Rhodopirellula sp. MGV]|uniref:hypothetical protein n=1 Tax=Rhodopirellula sp. MGV TaxID=2023130 RepID=UPI000B96779A|nr:hypothetical protein [Rhodopirellula sp. MGV]OYP32316.1 hypothetical protein CGZ80_19815 [Rhodopirellula sp. MGV]PNY35900.1 DUF2946 domain-containing protein [Rhodopirellula baltica]